MRVRHGTLYLKDGRKQPSDRAGYLDCDGDWSIQFYRPVMRGVREIWINVPRLKKPRALRLWIVAVFLVPAMGYSVPAK